MPDVAPSEGDALPRARSRQLIVRRRGAALSRSPAAAGPSTPGRSPPRELAEAQTFPYYRVYWVGPAFDGDRI